MDKDIFSDNWLSGLKVDELEDIVFQNVDSEFIDAMSIKYNQTIKLNSLVTQVISRNFQSSGVFTMGASQNQDQELTIYQVIKREFYLLICTKDSKYKELRKNLLKNQKKSSQVAVGLIVGAIGSSYGIPAGALTALCATALHMIIKVGKETFCTYCKNDFSK